MLLDTCKFGIIVSGVLILVSWNMPLYNKHLFVWKIQWQQKSKREIASSFICWFIPLSGCSGWNWARLKPGTVEFQPDIFHGWYGPGPWTTLDCFIRHIVSMGGGATVAGTSTAVWDPGTASGWPRNKFLWIMFPTLKSVLAVACCKSDAFSFFEFLISSSFKILFL